MKSILFFVLAAFAMANGYGQNIWRNVNAGQIIAEKCPRDSHPSAFELFSLDLDALKSQLAAAPSRLQTQSNVIVAFPNPQGQIEKFRIFEAPVLHEQLTARFPDIRSYVGKGIDDPTATIRFSVTLFGLHAMTFSGVSGTSYIDPYTKDGKNYIVYSRSSLTSNKTFECNVADTPGMIEEDLSADLLQWRSNNSLFKTYRLAMACTIEYAAFHVSAAGLGGGTLEQKKAAVLAAMNVTMTRVNGVYEREFALTMVIVPNNLDVIFIDSDDFDNFNTDNILLTQSQTAIDAIIGSANYDIGHTVSTGGGGVAQLQSPCSASKARGITGLPSPVGDPYDVDYVCHEMGHQYGCQHTFNGDQGACSGNRSAQSSFEPGSGSTIMGYTGLCNSQDIQFFSDPYFHARSLIQGSAFINGNGNCAEAVPNNNTPPTVSAGANYTIPFGTAFVLSGTGADADGDALTYCWEQYNQQISPQPPLPTSTSGPNFRTLPPSVSPQRYFPKFQEVLANNLTPTWEVVPNVARTMAFSLVARDNGSPLGGQTERATMTLTFANTGPFRVTSQQSNTDYWLQNSTQTVTWDVAGTDANGINTSMVNIRLSIDGGETFPYLLAENTPNDGSETITAPDVISVNCRIMVEAVGNVFYALNTKRFPIGYMVVNMCNTYTYDTPFVLNDGSQGFTVKTLNVPFNVPIEDTNITVNITHPNLQNLNIAVIRPGGSLMSLFNQQCAGTANMNMTFDAQGAPFACSTPSIGGYVPPTGADLNSFNGAIPAGNWQFGFRDLVPGDVGTVNSFSLEICGLVNVLATTDFAFEDFALFPNPNSGEFTLRFHSGSGNAIKVQVHDIRGRVIFDKAYGNSGLFDQQIRMDRAEAGIYLVSVADGDQKIVKRIIIE